MRRTLKSMLMAILITAVGMPLSAQNVKTTYLPSLARKILQFAKERGSLNTIHTEVNMSKIEINQIATEGAIFFSMDPVDAKRYFNTAFTNMANSGKITQEEANAFLLEVSGFYDGDDLKTLWQKLKSLKSVSTSPAMKALTDGINTGLRKPSAKEIMGMVGGVITAAAVIIAGGGIVVVTIGTIAAAFKIGVTIGKAAHDVGEWFVNLFKKEKNGNKKAGQALLDFLGQTALNILYDVGDSVLGALDAVADGLKKFGKALDSMFKGGKNKKTDTVEIGYWGDGAYHLLPLY